MQTHPLLFHASPRQVIAWRDGAPVTVQGFLADVARVADALPPGGHVFNVCRDRYRFAVSLCAALVAGRISLLPSTHAPETVRQLKAFAPDTFCLHDAPECAIDLPRFRYPDTPAANLTKDDCADAQDNANNNADDAPFAVPQIDAARVMAYVFTSGSTGAPVPHRKTWGCLVEGVRASAQSLGLSGDGAAAHTLVGTVPAQHMYGFESTVLLALIGGLAFSSRQPFYPADIRAELDAVPQPRVLVTSPIHLRTLLASDAPLPRAALVLSATAPLAEKLASEAEARLGAPLIEIYGSTETGQIATRRTAQGATWRLLPRIRFEARATGDEDSTTFWASGGHLDEPVPMGDALELLDAQRFLLHGRKQDLVNIAGKRTSIAYLNHQLNAIPGVTDGVFFMPDDDDSTRGDAAITRLVALVVAPSLSVADLQRALRERIDGAFMPRPLVFVDALPRNETGKLPRDVLAALAARHARATASESARVAQAAKPAQRSADNATAHALRFTIGADHPALPGHFPGLPIVPGVVLLDRAIDAIGTALDQPLDRWRLSAAKFLSPAAPGEALDLAFDAAASGAIRFTVRAGERDVASGTLAVQPAQAEAAR
ncbi:Acyl-coenzyme A synthetase/AMP-(Fatty) acid ligase [Paraburkholderia tropica]|uniref:AMP-binding protein n=1 Tax=Paraburkholderia tropica TaxID=92647 RepID=UPI001CAB53D8|nr:AMP-binding protein [Paraburkholderia tropica]CAG9203841.1 Acyl-coenzyme A synthetase/AMP-(Fatty) acid ligase [Paraburkholderia tropica]